MGETIQQALRTATERLSAITETARMDAELLMARAMNLARSEMLMLAVRENGPAPEAFDGLIQRRMAREPIAYILGHQEFFGRGFRVTPDVLIPRPDTETVVEAALEAAPNAARVLDLGTGSGVILVSCLIELAAAHGIGIDNSKAALFVAENNAQRHGLGRKQARFLRRDWQDSGWADDLGLFDLIVANPPYVEEDAELDPDVRDYEPAGALFAGPEGLDACRVLIPQLPGLLEPGGVAVLEIGYRQADAVTALAEASGFTAALRRDLGGRPRALTLVRKGLAKAP